MNITDDINIFNQDCLSKMKDIPDNSVDMILCDLPYGVLNRNNPSAKWDSVIPFEPLWEQYERITKNNAAIVLFASGMFTANLMTSNAKLWRYNLIWQKSGRVTGFLNARRQPLREHEDICIFSKAQTKYNPQMVKCEPHQRNHSRGKMDKVQTNRCYGDYGKPEDIITDLKYPKSILSFPHEPMNKTVHPTQKPVCLCEYLIKTYSDENDLILDSTMGSGSTGVACVNTSRKFIGIELTEKYYSIAEKRIADAVSIKENELF